MNPYLPSTSDFGSIGQHPGSYLFVLLLFTFFPSSQAQPDMMLTFDQRMKQLKTTHAKVLATWAGVNVITGSTLLFTAEEQLFYFHAMNASWGLVNTGVAAFIYYHHNHVFKQPQTLLQQMDHQRHAEKMILFNIGLDMAFVAVGMALYQHAQPPDVPYPELWKGFGTSVMIQGAFLLVQDIIFYRLHVKNRQRVHPFWQRMIEKL